MKKILVIALFAFSLLLPQVSFATAIPADVIQLQNPIGGSVKNPVGEVHVEILLGNVAKNALGILGSITLLVFVYGSFMWLTSAGKPDMIKKGTETMLWAAIGVCVIFASYAILNFVMTSLSQGYIPTEESPTGETKPIGATTQKPKPKAVAKNICENHFGELGLKCVESCRSVADVGAEFEASGEVGVKFIAERDLINSELGITSLDKKAPELKSNYVSYLCGSEGGKASTKVCCLPKPAKPSGELCDAYLGMNGLSCNDAGSCNQSAGIISSEIIQKFNVVLPEMKYFTTAEPTINPYSISNLCTGTKICCVKSENKCVPTPGLTDCKAITSWAGCSAKSTVCTWSSSACDYLVDPNTCKLSNGDKPGCDGKKSSCSWQ